MIGTQSTLRRRRTPPSVGVRLDQGQLAMIGGADDQGWSRSWLGKLGNWLRGASAPAEERVFTEGFLVGTAARAYLGEFLSEWRSGLTGRKRQLSRIASKFRKLFDRLMAGL
ncbi:MAG TPA: hypothetical protein DCE44_24635 [Verrucomicrobiales bacterium]|nr:hypothetical protein [Verrucomicrobiales bacterium]